MEKGSKGAVRTDWKNAGFEGRTSEAPASGSLLAGAQGSWNGWPCFLLFLLGP